MFKIIFTLKSLLKNEMIKPIVHSIFTIMCLSEDPLQTRSNVEVDILEDEDNEDENVDDTENLFTSATQVILNISILQFELTVIKREN